MELLLAAAALFFITRGTGVAERPPSGDGASQEPPPSNVPGDTSPNGGDVAGQVIGGITTAASAVGAVVGVVKGLIGTGAAVGGGAGATAGVSAGATGGAVGTTAAAEGGASAGATAAGATAGSASGLAVVGQAAIVVAVAVAIFFIVFGSVTAGLRGERWWRWTHNNVRKRYGVLLFIEENDFLEGLIDPEGGTATIMRRVPGTNALEPVEQVNYTRSRRYVEWLDYWNAQIGTYVPEEIALPERDVLMLMRVGRWRAMTKLRAYNEAQRNFWASMGYVPNGLSNAGLTGPELEAFFAWVCSDEPYAKELGRRCATDMAGLQQTAEYFFGPNIEQVRRLTVNEGCARALRDAGMQGYSFGWPGDEEFTREVVKRSGLGDGGGRWKQDSKGKTYATSGWWVDLFNVQGSLRWVAVDGLTLIGVDVVSSREREAVVRYAPDQLGLGELPDLIKWDPRYAPTSTQTVAELTPVVTAAATGFNSTSLNIAAPVSRSTFGKLL